MKKLINYTKKIYILLIIMFFLIWNISFWQTYESDDLMYQVFKEAISYWSIMEVWWKTSDDVWHEVLRWKTSIWAWESLKKVCVNPANDEILYIYDNNQKLKIDNERDCGIAGWVWKSDVFDVTYTTPLIARISKILLSVTMVLAITMIIFTSVKLMISILWWKDLKSSSIKKDLLMIIIWILLALFSVTIINLLRSVTKSSIDTSSDIDETELSYWCKFTLNGESTSMPKINFKEYLCLHETMWYEDNNLNWREFSYIKAYSNGEEHMDQPGLWSNRCKVILWWTRKRVIIKDSTAKDYCVNMYDGKWWLSAD